PTDPIRMQRLRPLLLAMQNLPLAPGAKIYCTPNDHLVISYYTGLPIGSVAAVRKSFLDTYPGQVVVIETGPRYEFADWEDVQQIATADGVYLTDDQARRWAALLSTHWVRTELT